MLPFDPKRRRQVWKHGQEEAPRQPLRRPLTRRVAGSALGPHSPAVGVGVGAISGAAPLPGAQVSLCLRLLLTSILRRTHDAGKDGDEQPPGRPSRSLFKYCLAPCPLPVLPSSWLSPPLLCTKTHLNANASRSPQTLGPGLGHELAGNPTSGHSRGTVGTV